MRNSNKSKNPFIKYSKAELEKYVSDNDSCVKKVEMEEMVKFSPTAMADLQKSILDELSRKIGRYDQKLEGVVLDFRDTKLLTSHTEVRQDSNHSALKIRSNWYIFAPRKDAVVTGVVKSFNRLALETIITVVVYRVFNVKVGIKGIIKGEIEKDQEIQIRLKKYHFENVIPYVEGEIVNLKHLKTQKSPKNFERASDSGVSMDESQEIPKVRVKNERVTSDEEEHPGPSQKTSPKKNLKRKLNFDEEIALMTTNTKPLKKIKLEQQSDCEFSHVNIKSEKGVKKEKKKSKKKMDFNATLESLFNSTM